MSSNEDQSNTPDQEGPAGTIPACPPTVQEARSDPSFCRDTFSQQSGSHGGLEQHRSIPQGTVGGNQCVYNADGSINTDPSVMGTADKVALAAGKDPVTGECKSSIPGAIAHGFADLLPYRLDPKSYDATHESMRAGGIPSGTTGSRFTDAELNRAFEESNHGYHFPQNYGYWCGEDNAPAKDMEGEVGVPGQVRWTDDWLREKKLPAPKDDVDRACMRHDLGIAAIRNQARNEHKELPTFASAHPDIIEAHRDLSARLAEAAKESTGMAKAYALGASAIMQGLALGLQAKKAFADGLKASKEAVKSFTGEKPAAVVSCPFEKQVWQSNDQQSALLYAKGKAEGKIEAGRLTEAAELQAGVYRSANVGNLGGVGGSYEAQVAYVDASSKLTIGLTGVSQSVEAEAAVLSGGLSGFLGKDSNNPLQEVGVQGQLLSAEAKGDMLIGDDGRRVGLAAGGKAGAAVASGTITAENNVPIPFTDWTLSFRRSVGGSVKSVGAGAEAHGYYDKEEQRFHLGGFMDIEAVVGASLGLDLSIGKKYSARERLTDW